MAGFGNDDVAGAAVAALAFAIDDDHAGWSSGHRAEPRLEEFHDGRAVAQVDPCSLRGQIDAVQFETIADRVVKTTDGDQS